MLIEVRIENYRSIREERALTLEAANLGNEDDKRPRSVKGHDAKLLPAAVIYGPNASGKSNLLLALGFIRSAVLDSQRGWEPDGGVPRPAFAWGDMRSKPSLFEVTFLKEDVKYNYGFVVDDNEVLEEWLNAWPIGHKQKWFVREKNEFKFGENLKGPNHSAREITRNNALFLSAAAQSNHSQLAPLYAWFRDLIPFRMKNELSFYRRSMGGLNHLLFPGTEAPPLAPHEVGDSVTLVTKIRQLLRSADIGICDIKRTQHEFKMGDESYVRHRIMLQHQVGDDQSWLDLNDESDGTQTLFQMAPSIFKALDTGGLLLIDELESSLHPLLGLAIVRLFNAPETNPNNAQLIFTTHDTNLLGSTLGEPPLRRDQIWFIEKDKTGGSVLYPLTDYKPRQTENIERGYLQGRYGAIPFLGDMSFLGKETNGKA
ncbi:AAA family ATPase [Rosistilla oblonga]|uniref:AAA family ATPase n=1 Tax=Rosistilla oblonga TaxID=2527990 RepID=UPI003A97A131